ncbi:MAG: hypothetical protein PWQ96_2215 [Clostridia bacterium]|jgi:selenium metabolism protein YedF|nr:SirA-like protein [Clostridiales bacterium]MDK2986571.1 hypothetical protein [Clostridia bacterium]
MENMVDARGKACPQPVICTKKALEKLESNNSLVTIVDNEVARDNVVKYAKSLEYPVEVQQKQQDFYIKITKQDGIEPQLESRTRQVVLLSSSKLGEGDDKLGDVLMKSFLYTLAQSDDLPAAVIMMNSGVKLAVEGSPVLEHLMELNKKGVEILACGTCLDFFNLKDKLCVGNISNMYTILEYLLSADKTLNF